MSVPWALLCTLLVAFLPPKCALRSDFAVVGYLPEYTAGYPNWDKVDFEEQCAHLTHLIVFSIGMPFFVHGAT